MVPPHDALDEFIRAACVPLDSGHGSGTLERAREVLAAHPDLPARSIHAAAILGDEPMVRRFLAQDPKNATARGGPHGWDALTHLCFSRYLRLDRARSDGFLGAARALLDSGASAATGFFSPEHRPTPEFESVLYGAAGVARHAGLTRLLLERGADPNDGEVAYHSPESDDNDVLRVLVESGKLTRDSLTTMLLRKADWHDKDGIQFLLEHGADPNRRSHWGITALQQALRRDNSLEIIELLLDHGADPSLEDHGAAAHGRPPVGSALRLAARRGRGDVLGLLERRGLPTALAGVERLSSACARDAGVEARLIQERDPGLVIELRDQGGEFLSLFAGNGNAAGVQCLLELGVEVGAIFKEGDGYFGVARNSTALHVAAWRARHATVRLLIERGAAINSLDGDGRTPLELAVRACVDSHWQERRTPESVRALLEAGARASSIRVASGYADVDALLTAHGANLVASRSSRQV